MTVATDQRKTGVVTGSYVQAQSGAASSVTGTTSETTLATIAIPPLGPNSSLRISIDTTATNNANTKTLRVKLGGSTLFSFGNASFAAWGVIVRIRNRNSTAVQGGYISSGSGVSTGTTTAGAIETAAATSLTITGQLGVGTDTFTVDGYTVEILP